MNTDCEVIRDLLPLYADDACSDKSRELVKEHLQECEACRDVLSRLRATEIENNLRSEKTNVIDYAIRRFKRRSAAVGTAAAALLTIPLMAGLIVNFISDLMFDWYFVVLASLGVLASVIAVPIMVPEDKLFWTFCAFTASLMVLLGVTCLYVRGDWFWIASSATLFGLAVAFLPALVHARPVKKLIGQANKALVVLAVDAALFVNMLNMTRLNGRISSRALLFTLLVFAGVGLVVVESVRQGKKRK